MLINLRQSKLKVMRIKVGIVIRRTSHSLENSFIHLFPRRRSNFMVVSHNLILLFYINDVYFLNFQQLSSFIVI